MEARVNGHLSLFSGIGGLDIAAEWAGFKTIAFVERDKYCQRVLAKHWPGVPIFDDVCKVTADAAFNRRALGRAGDENGNHSAARILHEPSGVHAVGRSHPTILSGGFPCQPHSVAGKRQASLDERDLWGECVRITDELRPKWCVFENVPGLLTSERGTFFARVLGDLAALGYRVGWGVWGANDVGAVHRRDRVFIVAYSQGTRQPRRGCGKQAGRDGAGDLRQDVADAGSAGSQRSGDERCEARDAPAGQPVFGGSCAPGIGGIKSRLGGMADGLPDWSHEPDIPRVATGVKDRVARLRALGNAVVPAQAYPIFKAIADIEGIRP